MQYPGLTEFKEIELMKKVTVNGTKVFDIEGDIVNGTPVQADSQPTGDRFWHVLHEGKSFTVELVSRNEAEKSMVLRVNDNTYTVSVKDPIDQLLESMGMGAAAAGKMKNLKAPMPGLVLEIRVKAGDTVTKGDPLLVLEAMKMENVLKAEGDGTVKSIDVTKGQNVEKM